LKFRLVKSPIARLQFVQSDVFCALISICSGVAKGYRCEDQALEMNQKVGGGAFWYLNFDFFWCLTPLSAISWRPVWLVDEAGVPGENHRPWASNW